MLYVDDPCTCVNAVVFAAKEHKRHYHIQSFDRHSCARAAEVLAASAVAHWQAAPAGACCDAA